MTAPGETEGKIRVKDNRDGIPIFIRSELDDYGLSPVEFRVYARLARRAGPNGKHSESVPNMAREFELSRRTVQYALKVLVECNLIKRHPRVGKTDEYSLNPRTSWRDKGKLKDTKKMLKELREKIFRPPDATTDRGAMRDRGATRKRGVVQPRIGVGVQPESYEGTPSEGTPSEGTPSVPSPKNGDGPSRKPKDTSTEDFTIWNLGIKKLIATGAAESTARSFMGEQLRLHGKPAVARAITEALAQEAVEPKAYIVAVLKKQRGLGPGASKVDHTIAAGNSVIAEYEAQESGV